MKAEIFEGMMTDILTAYSIETRAQAVETFARFVEALAFAKDNHIRLSKPVSPNVWCDFPGNQTLT